MIKLMFIMKIGVLSLVAVCLSCCSGGKASGSKDIVGQGFACRAVQVEDGYGYIVLHGSDTLIYQPYIPAVSGHQPFATEEDALKTGKLVCRKLDEGQPPTLSREEVKSCLTDTGLYHDKDQCLSR
jgi:hypothetical protein